MDILRLIPVFLLGSITGKAMELWHLGAIEANDAAMLITYSVGGAVIQIVVNCRSTAVQE